ncbi:MAG: ribonuclease P protein component [Roseovarius sp.]
MAAMTAPKAPETPARDGGAGARAPAGAPGLAPLRRRADFLALNRARRQMMPGMVVQGRPRGDGRALIRVGLTCSRRLGNAVTRNRAKRRLREVARLVLPVCGRPGWDYALIGRPGATATRDFRALSDDLRQALRRLHGAP